MSICSLLHSSLQNGVSPLLPENTHAVLKRNQYAIIRTYVPLRCVYSCGPVHEDVAAEGLVAESALVQEMVRLLRVHVGDAEHGERVPRRRRAPAALRYLHAGSIVELGGKRPASLRAAAAVSVTVGEQRHEVGVAERVEVGRRELHRPAFLGTSSRARSWHVEPVPELARTTEEREQDDGSCAWREQGGGGRLKQGGKRLTNGLAVN
jgi:hypothetical protein